MARLPTNDQKGNELTLMSEQDLSRVGLRIAELRKIHGITQQSLAARATVSYSLLRKVERGERPASPSFIAAIARALGVSVLDITEQPYGVRDADPTSEQAGIPALRQALVEGADPELDTTLRSMDDLRTALAQIKELDRRTKHAEVVQALPDVLRHLHRAVLDLPSGERPGAHDVLAAAYSYAVVALYRLGHLDLSHLADERARAAATQGDDSAASCRRGVEPLTDPDVRWCLPSGTTQHQAGQRDPGSRPANTSPPRPPGRTAPPGRDHRSPRDELRPSHRPPDRRTLARYRRTRRGQLLRHQIRPA
jgi:transcriptional regulator with XRE-family HTH domain